MGFLGRLSRVIPIHPDRGPRLSLRMAAEGLRKGLVLCVFPEGERSIDGALKKFRPGPAILATELGLAVVPVGIKGAWEVWPRGASRVRLHRVSVSFGKPLTPLSGERSYVTLNHRIFSAVGELTGSRQAPVREDESRG